MQTILDYLNFDVNNMVAGLAPIVISLFVSFMLGFLIYYVYSRSYRGVVYSHSFSVSLALMTILTTVVTLAISSNIALSLGMVGALSIVRYRAAIKDPMDLLFLFWAVTTGITTGAKMHYLAFISAIIVILMILFINRYDPKNKMYVIVIHYSGEDIDGEIRKILRERHYQIKSKTVRQNDVEIAAEIKVSKDNLAFVDKIKELPAVKDVTLVQYNGNYNG